VVNPGGGRSDSENDLDWEGEAKPRLTSLTSAHKNAIRAVRKIKYFVARRKFQQARKPYDVRDVMEQYSQGHLNMMVRIKELQRRLDQTLGKPGTYHHGVDRRGHIKPMTIGARLYRLENLIGNQDTKIDNMLNILANLTNNSSDNDDGALAKNRRNTEEPGEDKAKKGYRTKKGGTGECGEEAIKCGEGRKIKTGDG